MASSEFLGPVQFPAPALPEDPKLQRLLGLYGMREPGLLMQRIKIPGGRLTPEQWRRLAKIAEDFTPDHPLHLTTRQDIELHGVPAGQIPRLHHALAEAGLTTLGACGDTPRNITVCPGGGLCGGYGDLMPLALAVKAYVEKLPDIHALPRKFKISFSGCPEGCAQPWINDLAFVAVDSGLFDVIGAGSLGFRPGTGMLLARAVGVADVFAFVRAAIEVFQKHGDRQRRMRARLRHVRERVGPEAFAQLMETALAGARAGGGFPEEEIAPIAPGVKPLARLLPPLGDVAPAQARRLADLCEAHATWANLDNQHGIRLFGPRAQAVQQALQDEEALSSCLPPVSIVACPGAALCTKGIADSRAMALRLREIVGRVRTAQPVPICISGCPNQCAQSGVAAIGLVGLVRTIEGVRTECFRVLARGGQGRTPVLAQETAVVPAREAPQIVERLLTNWDSFVSI